ncbi:hypothetical protein SAMN04490248_11452 [Salinihabitans flavidus]|uniref:TIGR03862 family flavoprotein n=1 Tax=Salinihabitans flavidus TaxID=569882 RepID=A0A1H8T5D4_9RHOB|nr:TIGR03862 family flavoprotein [Salinihabitans flavidus]SEO86102.1 hypothetical protein SAMN04490248_11452 [Salinihabitans flavidus]
MSLALVIGGGPAGLMAAERLAETGARVIVAEAKPSVARKLLMAGKSGLNLTKEEPFDRFLAAYAEAAPPLRPMLEAFGPQAVRDWVEGLGQDVFAGSTGRVFPKAMKASPLVRAWLARLAGLGVEIKPRWRWIGGAYRFDTPQGIQEVTPDVVVLACGGASWARLGSDGAWTALLEDVPLAPFQPANVGFRVAWSAHMRAHFGAPVKGVALIAGSVRSRGEVVISAEGLEGGGIYAVARALREGAPLHLDLMPDVTQAEIARKLARGHGKASVSNHLRKALGLDPVKRALLMEGAPRPLPEHLAPLVKALPLRLEGPRPMDEAISVAGGVRFAALDSGLMLRARPGVFVAGEMIDWEAPTGGYLLNACFATGRWAGEHAARFLRESG